MGWNKHLPDKISNVEIQWHRKRPTSKMETAWRAMGIWPILFGGPECWEDRWSSFFMLDSRPYIAFVSLYFSQRRHLSRCLGSQVHYLKPHYLFYLPHAHGSKPIPVKWDLGVAFENSSIELTQLGPGGEGGRRANNLTGDFIKPILSAFPFPLSQPTPLLEAFVVVLFLWEFVRIEITSL